MSILGSVAQYYESGTTTAGLVALRAAINTMYADLLPDNVSRPFVVLSESGTRVFKEVKAATHRTKILDVNVSFDIYARDRAETEAILEILETVYLEEGVAMVITDRQHLATMFANRLSFYDGEAWQGTLELSYRIVKATS